MAEHAPHAVVIAGPNGSGKSTLTQRIRSTSVLGFTFPANYVNADEIAAELRAGNDPDPERTAFHRGRELRRYFREQHVSFAYETVLSHPSGLIDLQRLRDAGYQLTLVSVTTDDPELNIERIAGRVEFGGHDVPEQRVRARYDRFFQFLPRAVEIAQESWVFDATSDIELCLRTENGVILPGGTAPRYLQYRLVEALAIRAADREMIRRATVAEACLTTPDEAGGTYIGPIIAAHSTIVLQQLADGTSIEHDASLLNGSVKPGDRVCIRYHEGYGELER